MPQSGYNETNKQTSKGVGRMRILYKNWFVHNMFAHPLSEVVYWLARPFGRARAKKVGDAVHDCTIPESEKVRVLGGE